MERESKRIERREILERRDSLIRRQNELRRMRREINDVLNKHVAGSYQDSRKEALWILSSIDNRLAQLGDDAKRAEELVAMLDEQREQEKKIEKLNVLFIGGAAV